MPDATSLHHCLLCHPYIESATTLSVIIIIIIIIIIIYISDKKSYYIKEDFGLLTKVQKQERGDFRFWKLFWESWEL